MTVARLGIDIDSSPARRAATDLRALVPAAGAAERAVGEFSREARETAASVERMSGGFRVLGNGSIQNAAFQIGDFATQVGAGGRASVALAQQLPQLLGSFGALGAVVGAGVAIGIPVLTAAFGELGEEAVDLDEALGDAEKALSALADVIDLRKKSVAELRQEFAGTREEIDAMVGAMAQIAADKAAAAVEKLVGSFSAFSDSSFFQIAADGLGEITTGAANAYEQLGLALPAAEAFSAAVRDLEAAKGFDAQADALARVRAILDENRAGVDVNVQAVRDLFEEVTAAERTVRSVAAGAENLSTATTAAAAAAGVLAGAWGDVARQSQVAATWAAQAAAASRGAAPGGAFATPSGVSVNPSDYPLFGAPTASVGYSTFGYDATPPATPSSSSGGGGGGTSARIKAERRFNPRSSRW